MAGWDPDGLTEAEFSEMLAPLFEDAPRFIDRLAGGRPYGSWEAVFERALEIAAGMPEDEQLELIHAHPPIGAPPGSVSALSFVEQGHAGDRVVADHERVAEDLERLNLAYESRFGFRYVIFVAGRPRWAIVPLMEAAVESDRGSEKARALRDVVAIARDRAIRIGLMPDGRGDRTSMDKGRQRGAEGTGKESR